MTEWTKHTTHTDALETLGKVIGPDEKRDAIHLAVEPVVAGERLEPSDRVRLEFGVAYRAKGADRVGIVDPFLPKTVEAGESFWLVVYPREITSLRHVWEHPAFPVSESLLPPESPHAEGARQRIADWLKGTDLSPVTVDEFLEAAATGKGGDRGIYPALFTIDEFAIIHGSDGYGQIPAWVWDDVRSLGITPVNTPDTFGCSC